MTELLAASATLIDLLLKLLLPLVTWFLIVAGWRIVSDLQDRRERNKARLVHLLDLRSLLKEVERIAVEFHTGSAYDDALARKAMRTIKLVTTELRHLQHVGVVSGDWPRYVMAVRQSVTGKNFDRSTFKKLDGSSEEILDFESRKDQLDDFVLQSAAQLMDQRAPPIGWKLIMATLKGKEP